MGFDLESNRVVEIREEQSNDLVRLYPYFEYRRNIAHNLHFVFPEEKKEEIN
ncbi:hypothetical protein HYT25_04830 [Candidatus Pacearchaeota archaeon]|nr:hypothetical protein [Candidatus Pacearchaeota archaeon]